MKTRLLVLVLAFGPACDPALGYTLPGARTVQADGVRYVVDVGGGVEARFYANIFTIHGDTSVEVINGSPSAVTFQPTPTTLTDARGGSVPAQCQLPTATVVLAQGQSVSVRCRFEGRLAPMSLSYEPEFKSLTLVQPGFSQNGKALAIVAKMASQ